MMADRYVKDNLTLEAALLKLLYEIHPIQETEQAELLEAHGRILAEDIFSDINNPPFDRSPIDGYAVRSKDIAAADKNYPVTLKVIGQVNAGDCFCEQVNAGEAVRIMTGAPIPEGCDACVRQEDTDYGEEAVNIYVPCDSGTNYCYAGEDFKKGTCLLTKGTKIGYVETAVLASAGISQVKVYRKPAIALLTTGDELVFPGEELCGGKIYNSNLFGLAARLRDFSFVPVIMKQLPDEPQRAAQVLRETIKTADLVITTGGVSVGKKDIMHDVIHILDAKRLFWGIKIKPGMPTIFSLVNGVPVISLSGNPFGALANFELLVRPVLARMTGDAELKTVTTVAVLESDFSKGSGVRRFVRAMYVDGKVRIPKGSHSSGVLASMRGCNCFVDIPIGHAPLKAGELVNVILLNPSSRDIFGEKGLPASLRKELC